MFYNCNIEKSGDMYIAQFPDMPNILTYGNSYEEAISMAEDALNGVIETEIEDGYEIPAPLYKGGVPIEVNPQFESVIGNPKKEVVVGEALAKLVLAARNVKVNKYAPSVRSRVCLAGNRTCRNAGHFAMAQ